jgi:hypothetical protein
VHSCARVAVHDLSSDHVCVGDPVVRGLHAADNSTDDSDSTSTERL